MVMFTLPSTFVAAAIAFAPLGTTGTSVRNIGAPTNDVTSALPNCTNIAKANDFRGKKRVVNVRTIGVAGSKRVLRVFGVTRTIMGAAYDVVIVLGSDA